MASMYLLNTVTVSTPQGTASMLAGRLVVDATEQAVLRAAGGFLWPSSPPVVAASAYVTKIRIARCVTEDEATQIMTLAVEQDLLGAVGGSDVMDHFVPTLGQVLFPLSQVPSRPDLVGFRVNGVRYENGFDYTVAGQLVTWTNPIVLNSADVACAEYGV
jgi:hypothetical protein